MANKTKSTSKASRFLCISIVLMLICSIATCAIQTGFGKVKVTEINWEADNGCAMNGRLFVPDTATAENPAHRRQSVQRVVLPRHRCR